jgi:putative tryptophan/tyrosine transport system permease protein
MNFVAFIGALEVGLIFALVSLSVFLTFRVFNFPDLTVDGSFPLGAAVAGVLITNGFDPYLATGCAVCFGALAGLATATLNLRFGILNLLASILVMIALYSINLRVMGRPNLPLLDTQSVLTPFEGLGIRPIYLRPLFVGAVLLVVAALLDRFLRSEYGLAMRATGSNPRMALAQGVNTEKATYIGLALSNALVSLAGALFAQMNGFADVGLGSGTILVGLAAVIVGEAIIGTRNVTTWIVACCIGSLVYRILVAFALNASWLGLQASDLNLITAVLVAIALIIPRFGNRLRFRAPGLARP